MILYIHGFGGNGLGMKASLFREYYSGKERFYAPSLSYIPDLALASLEELITSFADEQIKLIGSSLGGFYTMYLSQKYDLPGVLINPAASPVALSRSLEGRAPSYHDGSTFEWNAGHTEMIRVISEKMPERFENLLALIKMGDEVVPCDESVRRLQGVELVVEEGGDHSFGDISRFFGRIDDFFHARSVTSV